MDKPASTMMELLQLPVVCLATADFDLTISDVVQGKVTVIDIWTTRCTRCPAALDKLNAMAATSDKDGNNKKSCIQYVSICCDKLDGAREILDRDSTPRWSHLRHFFMDHDHKERAKELLGFKQVPFYIVFDDSWTMVFSGNKLPDMNDLLQTTKNQNTELPSTSTTTPLPATKTTSEASSPIDVIALDFDELDF